MCIDGNPAAYTPLSRHEDPPVTKDDPRIPKSARGFNHPSTARLLRIQVDSDPLRDPLASDNINTHQSQSQRLNEGDSTSSMLGDLFRGLPEPLSPEEELRLATTLAGSGMGAGTLAWLTGYLASKHERRTRCGNCTAAMWCDILRGVVRKR
jgi:hypothetical protein